MAAASIFSRTERASVCIGFSFQVRFPQYTMATLGVARLKHSSLSFGLDDRCAHGSPDNDRLLKDIGGRIADVGTRGDHLAALEFHAAGGAPDACNTPKDLDEITREQGRKELDALVGNQQPLVAVAVNRQLGCDIAKE